MPSLPGGHQNSVRHQLQKSRRARRRDQPETRRAEYRLSGRIRRHRQRSIRRLQIHVVQKFEGLRADAQSPDKRTDVPTFGTSTELVYVRFHIEKKKDSYVDTVRADQLRVLEDGKPQTIALLETAATRERTIPPEITLALDVTLGGPAGP